MNTVRRSKTPQSKKATLTLSSILERYTYKPDADVATSNQSQYRNESEENNIIRTEHCDSTTDLLDTALTTTTTTVKLSNIHNESDSDPNSDCKIIDAHNSDDSDEQADNISCAHSTRTKVLNWISKSDTILISDSDEEIEHRYATQTGTESEPVRSDYVFIPKHIYDRFETYTNISVLPVTCSKHYKDNAAITGDNRNNFHLSVQQQESSGSNSVDLINEKYHLVKNTINTSRIQNQNNENLVKELTSPKKTNSNQNNENFPQKNTKVRNSNKKSERSSKKNCNETKTPTNSEQKAELYSYIISSPTRENCKKSLFEDKGKSPLNSGNKTKLYSYLSSTSPKRNRMNSQVKLSNIGLSPESMKCEFYSYLRINTNPSAQKSEEIIIENRRSKRVQNLIKQNEELKEKESELKTNVENENEVQHILFPSFLNDRNLNSYFEDTIETYFENERIDYKKTDHSETMLVQLESPKEIKERIRLKRDTIADRNRRKLAAQQLEMKKLQINAKFMTNFNLRRLRYRPNRTMKSIPVTRHSLDGYRRTVKPKRIVPVKVKRKRRDSIEVAKRRRMLDKIRQNRNEEEISLESPNEIKSKDDLKFVQQMVEDSVKIEKRGKSESSPKIEKQIRKEISKEDLKFDQQMVEDSGKIEKRRKSEASPKVEKRREVPKVEESPKIEKQNRKEISKEDLKFDQQMVEDSVKIEKRRKSEASPKVDRRREVSKIEESPKIGKQNRKDISNENKPKEDLKLDKQMNGESRKIEKRKKIEESPKTEKQNRKEILNENKPKKDSVNEMNEDSEKIVKRKKNEESSTTDKQKRKKILIENKPKEDLKLNKPVDEDSGKIVKRKKNEESSTTDKQKQKKSLIENKPKQDLKLDEPVDEDSGKIVKRKKNEESSKSNKQKQKGISNESKTEEDIEMNEDSGRTEEPVKTAKSKGKSVDKQLDSSEETKSIVKNNSVKKSSRSNFEKNLDEVFNAVINHTESDVNNRKNVNEIVATATIEHGINLPNQQQRQSESEHNSSNSNLSFNQEIVNNRDDSIETFVPETDLPAVESEHSYAMRNLNIKTIPNYIPFNSKVKKKSFHRSLVKTPIVHTKSVPDLSKSDPARHSSTHKIGVNKENGAFLNTFYVNGVLIIIQEQMISYWKQTALGHVLGVQNMWLTHGCLQRIVLDKGCVNRRSSQMVLNVDNSITYVELWTKEHTFVFRECPIADVFATVYFYKGFGNMDKKVLQLDNIKGYGKDVQFAVMKHSREIIVSWYDTFSKPAKSVIHSHQLAADFQTVVSVKEMQCVLHYISSLHNIEDCDDLVLASGNDHISVWNLMYGYLVTTLDLSQMRIQSPLDYRTNFLYAQCDTGFLFLIQQIDVTVLQLIAVNGITNEWKQLQLFKIPENYRGLLGVQVESGVLMTCYTNGFLCFNMNSGQILAEIDTSVDDQIILPCNKFLVAINNYQINVKHIMSFILTQEW